MPRNPKLFMHGEVRFLTFSVQEGLPLVSTPFMKMILRSQLARAQQLYPVAIGDYIVMSNHLHMFIKVEDPLNVDRFVRHFKTESAHGINKLMGRQKGSVWQEGYDSPVVLDLAWLKEKIVYTYSNPSKANIVDSIDKYPNLSSRHALKVGKLSLLCERIGRRAIATLPKKTMSERMIQRYTRTLRVRSWGDIELEINPRECFEALNEDGIRYEDYVEDIVRMLKEKELEYRAKRLKENKTVLGAARLRAQSIFKRYRSEKRGRRMICISSNIQLRIDYITYYRALVEKCKEVYRRWKGGDFSAAYPPGFFPPGARPVACMMPSTFWC